MAKGVWGIDVSKSSVKVVRLEGDTLTHSGVFPYDSAGTGEAPDIDAQIKSALTKYEAQSQIPFNIEEVIWDYQYVERDYQPGEEKEVILFAIKRDIVEQFLA